MSSYMRASAGISCPGRCRPTSGCPQAGAAQHPEVSIITVQNAYEQLAAEGYIYSQEKRGYYVSPVERPLQAAARQRPRCRRSRSRRPIFWTL